MTAAYKGFDHADIGQSLLNGGVEGINLFLHNGKPRETNADHDHNGNNQNRQHCGNHQCQAGIHRNGHDNGPDQHARRPQQHDHCHAHHILQLGHVVGQPCYQRSGCVCIQVGKGKTLHLVIQIMPQIRSKAGRGPAGTVVAPHTADQHHNGNAHHHQALPYDKPGIAIRHARIDNIGHHAGHQHFAHHFRQHQKRAHQKKGPIWLDILSIALHKENRLPFPLLSHAFTLSFL